MRFPTRCWTARSRKVGVLPDSQNRWMNPDMKVYLTTITINGTNDWLKPGMSAKVEILANCLSNVVYVPVQAVSPLEGKQVCYVANGRKPECRTVEVGEFNDEFIEIKNGLKEGERVLLRAVETPDAREDRGEAAASRPRARPLRSRPRRPPLPPPHRRPKPDGRLHRSIARRFARPTRWDWSRSRPCAESALRFRRRNTSASWAPPVAANPPCSISWAAWIAPARAVTFLGSEDISQLDDDALSSVRGSRLGFIFQSYNLIQQLTVVENIEVPLYYQGRPEAESRGSGRGSGHARGSGRPPGPQALRAVGRPATAGGHRARAGQRPARSFWPMSPPATSIRPPGSKS